MPYELQQKTHHSATLMLSFNYSMPATLAAWPACASLTIAFVDIPVCPDNVVLSPAVLQQACQPCQLRQHPVHAGSSLLQHHFQTVCLQMTRHVRKQPQDDGSEQPGFSVKMVLQQASTRH